MNGVVYNNMSYNKRIEEIGFRIDVNYINNKTKIEHICLNCDSTSLLRPDHLLNSKTKCRFCKSKSGFKITNEEYDCLILNTNLIRLSDYINTKLPNKNIPY